MREREKEREWRRGRGEKSLVEKDATKRRNNRLGAEFSLSLSSSSLLLCMRFILERVPRTRSSSSQRKRERHSERSEKRERREDKEKRE